MRYFVQFSYFGKSYHGWQKQPNALTVQEVLEGVFTKLLRKKIDLVGAGRTDTGVHAKEMYAHFDIDQITDIPNLIYRVNAFLPDDIAVMNILSVHANAHARFDAEERSYEYLISPRKDPFYKDSAHYIRFPLDLDEMNNAAKLLLGRQDFECFSKSKTDVKTYFCDVKSAIWTKEEGVIVFRITADRFLRNMVRAVVGTLLDVGTGKYPVDNVKSILKSKDRSKAGVSVPAKGLYLTSVKYPNTIFDNEQ
ncbi:tRNA pseudouridine(38-40) synthase TruA [Maribacter sp. MMG018]|uniref:tRNA pseudouridine(38-40) synthase TruA n=1 Tax=Maribacter sp. MMG018 TaxID=2822688 RepID=UPI001B380090|nr:tRNA pseudouridine(38-40) synthase TruA [Maribacter sp. MMG018]MBQ4914307.1 tRNA pseudouridine(38-40) synthase TruA [Maribacter sp. MMG018]